MKSDHDLQQLLSAIDGRGYAAYRSLTGNYQYHGFQLAVDHVQVDPYAPPSRARILLGRETAGFPGTLLDSKPKRIAVSDFLSRQFDRMIHRLHHGSRNGGSLSIDHGGAEILERTAVSILPESIEARFEVGLPAAGRRILGKKASHLLLKIVPQIVQQSLHYKNIDQAALTRQISCMLDQEFIRCELAPHRLVAFVANGSILPRESSVSDRPLAGGVPFRSPQTLESSFNLPSGKTVTGMGIPEGVTLIVGGGFHGKSTLLRALENGVYNHIPGDGREWVVTRPDAVKIRAEDGRSIEKVNISTFINHLPGARDTYAFSTPNASGSTSQAANVMEALEAGTSLLLIDEDTSATNFMIRDRRMKRLVAKEKEPITPFIDKVRPLYRELGVSTVLIVGGSGDYFDVADRVIMMDEYIPKDVSAEAKRIAAGDNRSNVETADRFGEVTPRVPLRSGFTISGRKDRIKTRGRETILYGKEPIDLSFVEQLIDDSQTRCIAAMIDFMRKRIIDDHLTLAQAADRLYTYIEQHGPESLSPYNGRLALPRKQELCAAINRYRGLKIARPAGQ
mgnify:CR=1 FL=1